MASAAAGVAYGVALAPTGALVVGAGALVAVAGALVVGAGALVAVPSAGGQSDPNDGHAEFVKYTLSTITKTIRHTTIPPITIRLGIYISL